MRWSKLLLTCGVLSSLTMIGCRQSSNDGGQAVVTPPPTTQYQSQTSTQTYSQTETTTVTTQGLPPNLSSPAGLSRSCYMDLCASDLSLTDLLKKSEKGSSAQTDYFNSHIEPLAKKLMQLRHTRKNLRLEFIKEFEGQFEELELTDVQLRIAKAFLLVFKEDLYKRKELETIYKKLEKEPYFRAMHKIFQTQGLPGYFAELHPNTEVTKAARLEAKYIVDTQAKLNAAANTELIAIRDPSVLRAIKGDSLDSGDLSVIMYNSYGMHRAEAIITGKLAKYMDSIPRKTSYFRDLIKESKYKKNMARLPEYSQIEMDLCRKSYFQSINLSPTKEQVATFRDHMNVVKDAALQLVREQNPAHAKIKNTEFLLPFTRDEINQNWIKLIKSQIADLKVNSEEDEKNRRAPEAFLSALGESLRSGKEDMFCQGYFDPSVNDSVHADLGSSRLSWLSVMYPRYGVAIMAHELGHVAFKYSDEHSNQVSCLMEKQDGQKKYANEDYSDLFASKVELITQKTLQLPKSNFGCLVALPTVEQGFVNMDTSDVHSSHMYRAVQFALNRKEVIPASCERLGEIQSPKVTKSCD